MRFYLPGIQDASRKYIFEYNNSQFTTKNAKHYL